MTGFEAAAGDLPLVLQIVIPIVAEIGLLILLLVVLTMDLFTRSTRREAVGFVAAVGMLIIMGLNLVISFAWVNHPFFVENTVLGGMIRFDMLATIFRTMILLAAALACLIATDVEGLGRAGEFYAVTIAATLGMCLMSASADLVMLFLSLETASISLYILAGFLRNSETSSEAGIKYYLFGAFTSGLFLYGLSLIFGFTGTTNIYAIAEPLAALLDEGATSGVLGVVAALLLILVGFGFKISAVPFHFWTPDVYEGAPTPVTAFISTASKAASFALLVRVFDVIWPDAAAVYWTGLLAALAVITMTLGNVLALVQSNVKRLLAYSSIAQAGYTLIGVVALNQSTFGVAAVAFYMFMYVLTNIAAFTVVIVVANQIGGDDSQDFAGLHRRAPGLALAMTLALLSLSGVPPLAGFFGKFFLFSAAVDAGYVWLAVIGVLNSIVALYYYLVLIKVMWVDQAVEEGPLSFSTASSLVLWVTGAGMIIMGTVAGPWLGWAITAAENLTAMVP
ncbi:MAG: NADH-quinone oxidoreductase subunit N [Chloroflexi bacterium]|nr:NADH-quinone oxidoreductase subunit N [Chloroflexota bacterium]